MDVQAKSRMAPARNARRSLVGTGVATLAIVFGGTRPSPDETARLCEASVKEVQLQYPAARGCGWLRGALPIGEVVVVVIVSSLQS